MIGFFTKLFIVFRILQIGCSLVALGCGVYGMYSPRRFCSRVRLIALQSPVRWSHWTKKYVAKFTTDINTFVTNNPEEFGPAATRIITTFDKAVASFFSGPPTRAYVLSVVVSYFWMNRLTASTLSDPQMQSLWSLVVLTYLLIALSATKHPRLNKRSVVIPLEIVTVFAWIAGFVCAILLVAEYSLVCYPYRYVSLLKPLVKVLEKNPILNDIIPSCDIDMVATVAAGVACSLFCITALAGCCVDRHGNCCGKRKKASAHAEARLGGGSEIRKPEFGVGVEPIREGWR